METYEIDRIYTWLMSAIGHNQEIEKKYLYDSERKLFFNIGYTNDVYHLWTNQIPLSPSDRKIIVAEIDFLKEEASRFIEITKSSKKFESLKAEMRESEEEYQNREKKWKELFEEAESFLKRNNIKIQETRLIE